MKEILNFIDGSYCAGGEGRWFDDVWTKEVFANFMADKMVNPTFPGVDHELNFLAKHYPDAYAVDRSEDKLRPAEAARMLDLEISKAP